MDVGRDGPGSEAYTRQAAAPLFSTQSGFSPPDFEVLATEVENTIYFHFGDLLRVREQFEAFKLETAQKEMTSSSEAQAFARQFEDQGIELQKARDEITRLTTELSTATERIQRLGQEVAELPKARADLAAARVRITEEAALTDTAQAELAEIRTWRVEATTLLTEYEGVVEEAEMYKERNLQLVEREQAVIDARDKYKERLLQLMASEDTAKPPRT